MKQTSNIKSLSTKPVPTPQRVSHSIRKYDRSVYSINLNFDQLKRFIQELVYLEKGNENIFYFRFLFTLIISMINQNNLSIN